MLRLQVGVGSARLLLTGATSLSSMTDFKFQFLSFSNVAGIILETVHELTFDLGLGTILLVLLAQLLELEPLQVDLLEALHARVVLNGTLESALRYVREARQ